jgi:hypothetical protein
VRWTQQTFRFTATSDSTLLSLFNVHTGHSPPCNKLRLNGKGIDDVQIQAVAVPEPATRAMMILGAGGIGAMVWTHRRPALETVASGGPFGGSSPGPVRPTIA